MFAALCLAGLALAATQELHFGARHGPRKRLVRRGNHSLLESRASKFLAELSGCSLEEADAFWETHPYVRSDDKTQQQIRAMQALREVKRVFLSQEVPLILVGDLLLGWRRGCLAVGQASVATFGQWLDLPRLQKALEENGHQLDAEHCPHATSAGCRLEVNLAMPENDWLRVGVGVLFPGPPQWATHQPGLFARCASACADDCRSCPLALTKTQASSGRFFACPLPLHDFRLITWMNDTFWVPADVDAYLAAEYDNWPETEETSAARSCAAAESSGLSSWAYPSEVPGLASKEEVARMQRRAEVDRRGKILAAATAESALWRKFFGTRSIAWPSRPSSVPSLPLAPAPAASASASGAGPALALALALVTLKALRLDLLQASLFLLYILLLCARSFLQWEVSTSFAPQAAVSNALAASLLQAVAAVGLNFFLTGKPAWQQCRSRPNGRQPIWVLALVPGVLQSLNLLLSFVSLSSLDPLSYLILMSNEAIFARKERSNVRRVLAGTLSLAASALVGHGLLSRGGGLGLAAAVAQVAAEACGNWWSTRALGAVGAPIDVLQACQHCQGFVVLLVFATLWCGAPFPSGYWLGFLESRSMPACVACMCLLLLVQPYLVKEVPSYLMASSAATCIFVVGFVQYELDLGLPASMHTLQALVLALLAAALHGLAANEARQRGRMQGPGLEFTRPASTATTPKKRSALRPPPPKKPWAKPSSEVGSTAAPSNSSVCEESDAETAGSR
ncbi:unnamed protein product [Effrenium voratum]|uniref:Uncharacterized protein n=1 Tax=Effrenium voratum TaxID=2562239 RepID=A0AA36I4H1_9DINO|nr:unnamed protein product [Effrenium voratum]